MNTLEEKRALAKEFMTSRGDIVHLVGYGSGFDGQKVGKVGSQLDMIVVTENTDDFHKNNILNNPSDYSSSARMTISRILAHEKVKFCHDTQFLYLQNISYQTQKMKYTVCNKQEAINACINYSNPFLTHRLSKIIEPLIDDELMNSAINISSRHYLAMGLLLAKGTSEEELFNTIANLTYVGDIRCPILMGISRKAKAIVKPNIEKYEQKYRIAKFYTANNGSVNRTLSAQELVNELPFRVRKYLYSKIMDTNNLEKIRYYLKQFLYFDNLMTSYLYTMKQSQVTTLKEKAEYMGVKVLKTCKRMFT